MNPDHDILVIGAGPTGLLVASELQRHGMDVALIERRLTAGSATRAIGVHATTLAKLEASGATERILAHATCISRGIAQTKNRMLAEVKFDRLRTRFPYVATIPQALTEWAVGYGAPNVVRGINVTSVEERGDRVHVTANFQGRDLVLSAKAVVIAAGAAGRHLIREEVRMRSHVYRDRYLMSDVAHATNQPAAAVITLDRTGVLESFPLPKGGRRIVAWDRSLSSQHRTPHGRLGSDREIQVESLERLRSAVVERTGDDDLAEKIETVTEFGIRRVLLKRMRRGRVFVIGDSAHEVSPIGG